MADYLVPVRTSLLTVVFFATQILEACSEDDGGFLNHSEAGGMSSFCLQICLALDMILHNKNIA